MPMVTKLVRVVIYRNLHLQKTYGLQTRNDADLQWEAPTLKATWSFDDMTNVWPPDNLKNLCLQFHGTYGRWTWQDAEFGEEFKLMFKSSLPTSCFKLDQRYGK